MHHRPWMRAAARLMSLLRSPYAWTLVLSLVLLMPRASHAQTAPCTSFTVPNANTTPSTSPMAAGTQIVINASGCDSGGGLTSESVATAHGHVTVDPLSDNITYVNNNDGATTDSFTFLDDFGRTVSVTVLIGAPTSTLTLSPTTLSNPQVGTAYNATVRATNGTGPYTYSLTGTLPQGLTFNSDTTSSTISGTPTASGTSNITINVKDSTGATGVESYTLTVATPQIVTNPLPIAYLNVAYTQTLTASGGTAPYKFTLESGTLPAGLSLNTATGVISGTPTATGAVTFGIRATDSSPGPVGPYFTVTSLTITVQNVPPVANPVSATVVYDSTNNPITLNITGSTATSVAVGTAAVHGTATASGTSITYTPTTGYAGPDTFTYTATNGAGTSTPATVSVTVGPPTITYTPLAPSPAQAGVSYNASIAVASGGKAPYTYAVTSGALPAGLTLNSNGSLTGTPTAAGSFNVSFTATDSSTGTGPFSSAPASLTLTVNPATIALSPTTLPNATLNATYNQSVIASGGTSPYTFAVSGTLPPGMSLSSSGVLSGKPTSGGSYNFSISATDSSTGSGPFTGTQSYTMSVTVPTITLAPASLPAPTVGASYSQAITASGGTGPYTYTVTSGFLPAGLQLSSSGALSGTPTAGGSFTFVVTATDANTNTGSKSYTLAVNGPTVVVSPSTLSAGTDGVAYSQTLNGTGGTAPYSYAITSGALPPGMTLASTGALSGTPTGAGTYNFTVQAMDSSTGSGPYAGTQAYTLTVNNPTLVLTPSGTSLSAIYAQSYTQTFSVSGGTAPYAFTESGALPNGVSWNAVTATLSGTPTQPGNFSITITATDQSTGTNAPFSVSRTYTLSVAAPTITLTPGSLSGGTVGAAYNLPLTASGGVGPYTFNISAGGLPAGMSLSNSGSLSGTPTAAGTFNITVTASDAHGATGSQAYSLIVNGATVALTPATLPSATVESAYSQTFSATGGTAPYTFALTSGSLPVGLSLNTATGALSGTPSATGTYTFTVRATDSSTGTGAPFTATVTYTVTVNAPTITVAPTTLNTMQVGVAFSQQLTASGGNGTYTYAATGSLPPGITLSSSGLLAGTPTAGGSFNFAVTAKDGANFSGSQGYTASVGVAAVVVNPATVPAATAESAYTQTMTATGGTAPYSFAISAGALPPGLSLSSAGTLSGTPTAAGTYNVTVRATDSSTGTGAPFSGTRSITLTVNAPAVTVSPATLNPVQLGVAFSQQLSASGGNGSYTYAVSTGSLPSGMTLSTAGLLAGTPTATGTFNLSITAKDSLNFSGTQAYTITIGTPTVAVNPASLSAGTAESAYTQTVTATGGTAPYTFAISAGALPAGLSLSASGTLSGTPIAAGTFNVTVRATDSSTGTGAPFSATRSYTLTVNAPSITLSPGSLGAAQTGVAFSQQLSASGGNGSYTFSVSGGSLPAGLSLAGSGALTGTPTAAGSYAFSIAARDSLGFTGTQSYTLNVAQPVPVAVNDTASTNANTAVTVPVTANDSGPITSIAISQQPTHGTATVSGLNVVYTPANNYFGSDSLNYTATGPGGTSAAATVSITVVAGAVPVLTPQAVTVLSGKSVIVNIVANAPVGPFFNPTVVTPPTSGTVVAQGNTFVYTAAADVSGTFGFDFTISNVFGVSRPAHVTVTVNPTPMAPTLSATVVAGKSVQVDLTTTAHGGPFTGAKLVSVSPANAGSASIQASGSGYVLSFAAAPTFSGAAQLSYTLSNAFAESAPGTVNVSVTPRSDPSKDAEVLGVLDAQADAARRVAMGQISNFQRRLESLHGGTAGDGFTNGITMSSASSMRRPGSLAELGEQTGMNRYRVQPDADDTAAAPPKTTLQGGSLPGDVAVWTGGAINFGKMQPGTSDNGIDFTTSGLSMGVDKAFSSSFAAGLGVGYGHDASDVGRQDSRSVLDSYNVAMYASFHPIGSVYVDGLLGYQWLRFDARRYVTDDGNTVHGRRDGTQLFGSLSVGYQHPFDNILLNPYGRLDIARAHLDGYTETGDATYALAYQRQTVKTSTATLGVLAQWMIKRDYGVWSPQLRAEYGHDMQGSSQASMRYADVLSGPLYQATLMNQSRNHGMLGAGVALQTLNGWLFRMEYQAYLDNSSSDNQSILLGVEKKFDP